MIRCAMSAEIDSAENLLSDSVRVAADTLAGDAPTRPLVGTAVVDMVRKAKVMAVIFKAEGTWKYRKTLCERGATNPNFAPIGRNLPDIVLQATSGSPYVTVTMASDL